MNVVLCCNTDTTHLEKILSHYGDLTIFKGVFDKSPGVQLAYSLQDGKCFDLVIVALDGANGLTDCQIIRRIQNKLPIIWITEQEEFIHASKRIGINGFLVKPTTEESIVACVEYCKNSTLS